MSKKKVEKVLAGELDIKLTAAEEVEVLKAFRLAAQGPAEAYAPAYRGWRRLRDKVRRGKFDENSQEYLDAVAERKAKVADLHAVLKNLCLFALKVSPVNYEAAHETIHDIMKIPAAVHALVTLPAFKKWSRETKAMRKTS